MVTISAVRIANMALSHIGARSSIESLDESSPEAKQCKLWYDYSRQQALASYDWSFARKRQALAVHADDPPEGVWNYRYVYPSDCLKAQHIVNLAGPTADAVPYNVEASDDGETKTILTDTEDAVLVYTFDQTSTAMFTPLFIEMLSHLLAHHIAFSLTGKKEIRTLELQIYNSLVNAAPAQDANEKVEAPPREAEWIRGR